jgi:L-lactate dehydrogenase complex protein LldG
MSRDDILARIDRANAGRGGSDIAAEAAALIAAPDRFRATFADVPPYERFVAKATSETVTATVEDLATLADLPGAVRRYMGAQALDNRLALQPRASLMALDWSGMEIAHHADMNEAAALTFADAGIAETGSLVFLTAPDAPVLLNFLPLHHLVVLRRDRILRHMEDVFDRFGSTRAEQGRSLNVITGTSGTADIEARNVRGAHGPRFMRIFCLGT